MSIKVHLQYKTGRSVEIEITQHLDRRSCPAGKPFLGDLKGWNFRYSLVHSRKSYLRPQIAPPQHSSAVQNRKLQPIGLLS